MQQTVEGKEDHEAALAVWDCGSPLYDSYELVSVSHLIERHMMAFPYLGGSSKRFIAKFSRASSSERTLTTSSTTTTMKEAKGSNSMEESLSEILGIKKMWKRKGLLGGKKDKTKKMKTAGCSGIYRRLGLWRKKERSGRDEMKWLSSSLGAGGSSSWEQQTNNYLLKHKRANEID